MPPSETGPAQPRRPWRAVVVATAAVLALLSFYQVVSEDAMIFAVAALLYAGGAMVIGQGRPLGYALTALPSAVLVVVGGWALLTQGLSPGGYAATADFLVAVLGLPLAALNLLGVARELGDRTT
jgi:hypothetical protein